MGVFTNWLDFLKVLKQSNLSECSGTALVNEKVFSLVPLCDIISQIITRLCYPIFELTVLPLVHLMNMVF